MGESGLKVDNTSDKVKRIFLIFFYYRIVDYILPSFLHRCYNEATCWFRVFIFQSVDTCKLTRKESYKAQRKNYRMEKKRVANELLSSLKDPTVIVMSDWLKVRGTLKSWTKLWCILKPGLLLLYKSPKIKVSIFF